MWSHREIQSRPAVSHHFHSLRRSGDCRVLGAEMDSELDGHGGNCPTADIPSRTDVPKYRSRQSISPGDLFPVHVDRTEGIP
jgi:hypothetical protein